MAAAGGASAQWRGIPPPEEEPDDAADDDIAPVSGDEQAESRPTAMPVKSEVLAGALIGAA